jgi:glycosyltransferase involved in cell wall biosynthesis
MPGGPRVSVIIPTYNRAYILRDAIESALSQEGAEMEIVVVDDGSTDSTADLAAQYGSRVVYLLQDHHGAAPARNLGLGEARGDYIAFLDSDDVWLPGKVSAELDCFERFPEADAIASDADSWLDGHPVCGSWLQSKGLPASSEEPFLIPRQSGLWLQGSRFATCSIVLRRRCLDLVPGALFDATLQRFEDWEMEIRLFRYCRILVLPRLLSHIRRYTDGARPGNRMPGADPTPEERRRDLQLEIGILERAMALGWPAPVEQEIQAKCRRHAGRLEALR